MFLDKLQKFIQDGKYLELKQLEKKLYYLRNCIMGYQKKSGQERVEWRKQGGVGFFSRTHIYEENKSCLFDYLNIFGLLPYVVNIQWDKLSTEEQKELEPLTIQRGYYLRFWPNKSQIVSVKEQFSNETVPNKQEVSEMANEWRLIKWKYNQLEEQWTFLKVGAIREWGSRDRKIKLSSGSLSVVKLQPQIHPNIILEQLDPTSLIRSGSVNYEKVIEFAAKGYFNKSDIDKYRKIKDISIRYVLMEIYKESKRYEHYKKKLDCLSELSRQR
jgi:hypothetical protein